MSHSFPSSYSSKVTSFDSKVYFPSTDENYGTQERRVLQRLLKATGPLTDLRILESGCGTGRLTWELARHAGPSGCIIAMDISPQMVATARQRLAGFGNVKLYLGAAEVRARSLGRFDQVICHQICPQFMDQKKALSRLSALLNPFGLIVISQLDSFVQIKNEQSKADADVIRGMMPDVDDMRRLCKACGLEIETWWNDQDGYLLSARLN